MKRDVDLSRAILAYIEEHAPPLGGLEKAIEIPGYDDATTLAHTELLIDEGLIDGEIIMALMGPHQAIIRKLTNRGHDAIAAAKSDTTWQKVKTEAKEKGVSVTFGLLVEMLKAEARRHLGLP